MSGSSGVRQRGGNPRRTVYLVNLAGRLRNGIWKLRVRDSYAGGAGHLDAWTITL